MKSLVGKSEIRFFAVKHEQNFANKWGRTDTPINFSNSCRRYISKWRVTGDTKLIELKYLFVLLIQN